MRNLERWRSLHFLVGLLFFYFLLGLVLLSLLLWGCDFIIIWVANQNTHVNLVPADCKHGEPNGHLFNERGWRWAGLMASCGSFCPRIRAPNAIATLGLGQQGAPFISSPPNQLRGGCWGRGLLYATSYYRFSSNSRATPS